SMANAINYTKAGVTASVATDSKTGLSYLNITSDKTGTGSSFTITDKAGNASAVSGANNSTVSAQDAIYSIDGKENTSQTNEAVLDNGKVKIGFTKADGKDINVSVDTDVNSIKDDITKFVNDYNKLISLTHSYSGTFSGASQLEKEFGSALNSKKVSLENAGIHINKDNTLSVDNTKLEKSLKSNTTYVRSIFTGSSGLADKVTSKSNAVIAAPLKYTNLDDMQNNQNSFINYLNSTNKVSPTNPYSGLLVNMLL
ncbi:MAG: flagellar filament capping protein FliD, partial [Bacillota bacterium]|nr:flagellar filament capping protein FliD [Bacillota bacterium]